MSKSSLMTSAAERLPLDEGINPIIIDLTAIGAEPRRRTMVSRSARRLKTKSNWTPTR
ncbi:MAG: hypothetical protein U0Y68_07360 [Blastocatellia bacterium]